MKKAMLHECVLEAGESQVGPALEYSDSSDTSFMMQVEHR